MTWQIRNSTTLTVGVTWKESRLVIFYLFDDILIKICYAIQKHQNSQIIIHENPFRTVLKENQKRWNRLEAVAECEYQHITDSLLFPSYNKVSKVVPCT